MASFADDDNDDSFSDAVAYLMWTDAEFSTKTHGFKLGDFV
jgi:hypothetical protein